MATSMLLQATPGAVRKNEMYTMLQAPPIGGVRRFGAGRKGHGVCSRRKAVLIGFRAQSGLFTLPGTKKVKKDESEDKQETEPDVRMGTRKIRKLPGTLKFGKGKKDNKVVFVAGATGKVGSRVVRELLESGFQVRAGVRDVAKGQALLEMLDETKSSDDEPKSWAAKLFKPRTLSKRERVELVECDLENEDAIEDSLGNAGVVVCAIGASEKEVLDTTGPYRIDYKATVNLVKAASNAKVNHFILVTSLGTTKLGWPASVLNLFWGVLIWKAKAEKALEESGLPYTIVRPGGMERPTDAYKETHNLVLAPKDTYSGGQVSSLQVAELIATCVSNLDLSRFKVLEAIAETTAPLRPIEDLLAEAPAVIDGDDRETTSSEVVPSPVRRKVKFSRQQEEKSSKAAEADEKRKKDLQEKSRKAAEADEKKKKDLQEKSRKAAEADERKRKELLARYERDLQAAREDEEEAKKKADEALSLKAELEKRTADLQVQARTAAREVKKAKALENAMVAAARQGRRLSEKEKRGVLEAAAAEFDGEPKSLADTEKVSRVESEKTVASSNSKPEKGLKFEALQAAKLKEADDRAAKNSAEKDRLAKQQEQVVEKEEKERVRKQEMARLENETKAKAESEAKAQAEKDRVTREKNEAWKAKAEAEAKAQAEKDRVIQEKIEAKAKEDAEAITRSKKDEITKVEDAKNNEVIATAQGPTFRWPWQKRTTDDDTSENFTDNERLKQNEDLLPQTSSEPVSAASDEALLDSPDSGSSPLPSVPAIEEEVSNFVEEVVEDTEAMVDEAKKAKEEAATRAAIALEKAKGAASGGFRWPWQKESTENDVSSETSAVNVIVEDEDAPVQVDSEPESSSTPQEDSEYEGKIDNSEDAMEQPPNVINELSTAVTEVAGNAASDEASPESADSETSPPLPAPSASSAIKEEVPKFVEEIVEDTEVIVEKARKAKEDAATRAAIALDKARGAASGSFRWPWQKESAEDDASSETSAVNESLKENEDITPQVDLEPEPSSTSLEGSEYEGTTDKPEDVMEQSSNVINGLATAITEVSENAGDVLDSTVDTNEVPEGKEGSLSNPEEENNGAPLLSEKASEPVNAASDDALLESPDSEISTAPAAAAIEDELSEFVEEVVEDAEAMADKAKKAKEEAATRASIALEKARGDASGSFRWPWQKESAEDDASSETSVVNESLKENEDVTPQVDLEPESSSTSLEGSEYEGTTDKPEDVMEQSSNVINGLATATTEVAENAGDVLDSTVDTNEVPEGKEGSLSNPEEENNGPPLLSEKASEPVSAASDDALPESPDSEISTAPAAAAIEEELSEFVEEVVEDAEAMVDKAKKAKEEAAARAAIALEKAKGDASGSLRWPWQEE